MDPSDRPKLPPTVYRAIESAQIKINNYYWMSLLDFQVSIAAANLVRLGFPDLKAEPPKAKRPDALRAAIARYARDLFAAEASQYPTDDGLERFLLLLAERTVEQVVRTIASVEDSGKTPFRRVSLAYHGLSVEEMRETARETIEPLIAGLMTERRPEQSPAVQEPDPDRAKPPRKRRRSNGDLPVCTPAEIERRAKLLREYKEANKLEADMPIYTARHSGLHKPQFYEWLNGFLPPESATTRNFERFLTAQKPPIPRKIRD